MSEPESKNDLSQQGKRRKEAMLEQLQQELACVHSKRRQRRAVAKGGALVAVLVIAGLAWSIPRLPNEPERRLVSRPSNNTSPRQQTSLVESVGNVTGIVDRCLVGNIKDSVEFETVTDDELLELLAAAGKPSVLGKINGKLRVISKTLPGPERESPL